MADPTDSEHGIGTPSGACLAALPADHAFVVQLRADVDLAQGIIRGRIEHVVSGTAALFDSVEQLVGHMHDTVAACTAPPLDGEHPPAHHADPEGRQR
jgi:hypothetical protein